MRTQKLAEALFAAYWRNGKNQQCRCTTPSVNCIQQIIAMPMSRRQMPSWS
ncbi:hypothetical protein KCP77_21335 [Salmonella enterica subsp. enterica]|nr:hypothetical protein KCP77_21335 [Salmonella enterica subsp. enterica]